MQVTGTPLRRSIAGFQKPASLPTLVRMSSEQVRVSVRYTGNVQGVGFRVTARHTARDFPVTGLVRNEPGGTVWLEVQGSRKAVRAFMAELRRQMNRHIHAENEMPAAIVSDETAFEIRR